MLGDFVSKNGELIPTSEANISIDNIHFTYGFGVYENLRVRDGHVFFIQEHIDRLFNSAKKIGLEHDLTKEKLKSWINDLQKKNTIETGNIKMILIGGRKKEDAELYIFHLQPKFLDKKFYKSGVHVITKKYERYLPQAKTLNMLPSYVIFREVAEQGAYDALLIDNAGNIPEGTRSNFFAIKEKTIYTPPTEKILNGMTRQTVIECAKKNGYRIIEQNIEFKKIFDYDSAFLTNTSGKIIPIKSINDQSFDSISKDLSELIKLYNIYLDEIKKAL